MLTLTWLVAAVVAWAWLGRRSLYYLLPAYFLLAALDLPGSARVLIYPERGFGFLDAAAFSAADVLLVATVLVSTRVRHQLRGLPLAFGAVSLVSLTVTTQWDLSFAPDETVWYLAAMPLRLGLLVALFRAEPIEAHGRELLRSVGAALGALFIPVVLAAVGMVVPAVESFATSVGMRATDGRIAFAGLGNNKIGLALLLLAAVLVLTRAYWQLLYPAATMEALLLLAVVIAASASLRFSTTALLVVMLTFALRGSPAQALVGLFASAAAVAAFAFGLVGDVQTRSLSVVSGRFDLSTDSSLSSRQRLWDAATAIWRDDPVFGAVGQWEWGRQVPVGVLRGPIETHSEYLWWLASFGVVGTAVLVFALVRPLRMALTDGPVATLSVVLALLGLALNSATYFPATAAALALLVAVADSHRRARGVLPDRAVRPDRLAEGRVVGHRASAHGSR